MQRTAESYLAILCAFPLLSQLAATAAEILCCESSCFRFAPSLRVEWLAGLECPTSKMNERVHCLADDAYLASAALPHCPILGERTTVRRRDLWGVKSFTQPDVADFSDNRVRRTPAVIELTG